VALFRIAQEALANVAKHARARNVRISLQREAGDAVLEVADDGRGFDAASRPGGGRLGMTTMRERAAAVGARLEVDSTPGGGTSVRVALPEAA
jgi:signal transduction histidine kinase